MSSIKVPITRTDKEGFQVTIDLNFLSEYLLMTGVQ